MNAMRSILRQLLFAVPPKGLGVHHMDAFTFAHMEYLVGTSPSAICPGSLEQLDHSKPISVPAGKVRVKHLAFCWPVRINAVTAAPVLKVYPSYCEVTAEIYRRICH